MCLKIVGMHGFNVWFNKRSNLQELAMHGYCEMDIELVAIYNYTLKFQNVLQLYNAGIQRDCILLTPMITQDRNNSNNNNITMTNEKIYFVSQIWDTFTTIDTISICIIVLFSLLFCVILLMCVAFIWDKKK